MDKSPNAVLLHLIEYLKDPENSPDKEFLSGLKSDPETEENLHTLKSLIKEKFLNCGFVEKKVDSFNDVLLKYAQHDYSAQAEISDNDLFDSLALSINFLGEELNYSTIATHYLRDIFNSMNDMLIAIDNNGYIVSVNNSVIKKLKYSDKDLLNEHISKILPASINLNNIKNDDTIKKGHYLISSSGNKIPVLINVSPFVRGDNKKTEIVLIARDITALLNYQLQVEKKNKLLSKAKKKAAELDKLKTIILANLSQEILEHKKSEELIKAQLKEKEVLLKEIHHRVKNNMQVIISLLNLQSASINDVQILELYKESQNRIKSMALIHEKLYQSKDFSHIDFSEYLSSLASYFSQIYQFENLSVDIVTKTHKIPFEFDTAITLGLIVNELVSNAMKYAFKLQPKGKITIVLKKSAGKKITLEISDNGCGMPKRVNYKKTKSLGLQLVCTLTEQIGGMLSLDNTKGAHFKIEFPMAN
jgi:PAS domain S-box-containing protein